MESVKEEHVEPSSNWSTTYNKIKELHDTAFHTINEAIQLEENKKLQEALKKYEMGMKLINDALNIIVECPQNADETWTTASTMIEKMDKIQPEIKMRIERIIESFDTTLPSYEEATNNTNLHNYSELICALSNMELMESNSVSIIYAVDNVKLYFISNSGSVQLISELQTLEIGLIEHPDGSSRMYLQVGEWLYPLIPDTSPCFRTQLGAYIFPDLRSGEPGSSVAVILPSDAEEEVYRLLEDILHGIVSDVPADLSRARRSNISESISHGIVTGANYISSGLLKGAEKTSEFLNYGTPKIINRLQPSAEAKPIPNNIQKSFAIARSATSTAANVTGFIANKVASATSALGKYLAPHIEKGGTKILSSGFQMSKDEAQEKMHGLLTVAAGTVEGFATVYEGLQHSASVLGQSLSQNTVKIVEHKYGQPSGVLADNTLQTVGNIVNVSHNVNYMVPRGIAKHVVKATGKAMVEDKRKDFNKPGTSQPSFDGDSKKLG